MAIGTILTALSLLKDLAPSVGNIAEKFLDGKATKEDLDAAAASEELSAEVQLALAQITLNKEEAKAGSLFISGWRPFVGWTCGLAMAFNFLVVPVLMSFGLLFEPLDISVMMPVLLGMLGIGGLRSYEKVKKVERNRLEDF